MSRAGVVRASRPLAASAEARIAALDWSGLTAALDSGGCAVMPPLLSPDECAAVADSYGQEAPFRSRVVMARHGFGRGEYQYFAYPLPGLIQGLRTALYPHLATLANRWNEAMGIEVRFPLEHADFLARCHGAGQTRPTPLLLRYGEGDYNCLHQDFTGGEFVLTEQRPRMQSRVEVVPLTQGAGVLFPVHHRPVQGTRGVYRVNMRHGVSRLRSGHRHTLGIIFHDAS
jgi:hypothetical protein